VIPLAEISNGNCKGDSEDCSMGDGDSEVCFVGIDEDESDGAEAGEAVGAKVEAAVSTSVLSVEIRTGTKRQHQPKDKR